MSLPIVLAAMVLLIFVLAWYSANKLQSQVHILYRRGDKTIKEGFVKRRGNIVIIEGAKYRILPDRIALIDWKRGIHQFLPIKVQHLDYTWDDEFPHDPSQYDNPIISPEVRNAINQEERLKAYARSQGQALSGKKAGSLEKYLPWIAIIGLLLLGVFLYNMSQQVNLLENMLKAVK